MIMNKLKMNLALIALAFPLLLCAKTQRIEMDIWHRKHRTPTELFVQIEAFFDDCNKGYVVYRNLYIPHSNSSLSTSLENIPAGIYELTITDEKGILAGEFIYEN